MLPYGKRDRPIYPTASLVRAKESCDRVPFDFPGAGLWRTLLPAQAAVSFTSEAERGSAGL
jgi:hypothetical protein